MEKDFERWSSYKKLLEKREYNLKFREGEIWNCYVGENIGCEECGKNDFLRPVVIIRKISKRGFIGIPTSSKPQIINDWFQEVSYQNNKSNQHGYVLLTQIRFFDAKRLSYKKAKINNEQLKKIRSRAGYLIKALEKVTPSPKMRGLEAISTILFVSLVLLLVYQIGR